MIEATTNPALRHAAHQAHVQRSQAAWRMIDVLRSLPARLVRQNGKRAALRDGPSLTNGCAA